VRATRDRGAIARPRLLPGQQQPHRACLRGGVLDPPLERAERERARLEVAADDRAELLADDPDAEIVRLERLPGPREQGVVRALARRERIDRRGQVGGAEGREEGRPRGLAVRRADMDREPVDR
jgi:hypothetical protein